MTDSSKNPEPRNADEAGPHVAGYYERAGFRKVPMVAGEKRPAVAGFTKDAPDFDVPCEHWPEDGVPAVLLGPCPAGAKRADRWLLCIDLDNGATREWFAVRAGGIELPPTCTTKGGSHVYYWVSDVPERAQLRQWRRIIEDPKSGKAVDLCWRGGYAKEPGGDRGWVSPAGEAIPLRQVERVPDLIADLPLESLRALIKLGTSRFAKVVQKLVEVWPREVNRHNAALALGGLLGCGDCAREDAERLARAVFEGAGTDDRADGDVMPNFDQTRAAGGPVEGVYGGAKLREILEGAGHSRQKVGAALAALRKWAGITAETGASSGDGSAAPGDLDLDELGDNGAAHARAIEDALASRLYQRGGRLVRVQQVDVEFNVRRGQAPVLGIAQVTPAALMGEVSDLPIGIWKTVSHAGKATRKRVNWPLPYVYVSQILEQERRPGTRKIRGIATCPLMRPDGSILQVRGYDAATGWYLEPDVELVRPISEDPSPDEIDAAKQLLLMPFADFPWVDESHKALPLSLILSLLARPAIAGDVPAHAVDASTPGAGKGKVAAVCTMIPYGQPRPAIRFHATEAENEKRIDAMALAGQSVIFWDNVPAGTGFGGAAIESSLTCNGRYQLRALGSSEAPTVDFTAVHIVTGNNLVFASDTPRRVLVARLEPDDDKPELRSDFKIPDLLAWTREHRGALVWAGLTLLRAHRRARDAGRAPEGARLGSFESWSQVVADCVQWAFGWDPRGLVANRNEADESRSALALFAEGLAELCGPWTGVPEHKPGPLHTDRLLALAAGATAPGSTAVADGLAAHQNLGGIDDTRARAALRKLFATHNGMVVGGFKLESRPVKGRAVYSARRHTHAGTR